MSSKLLNSEGRTASVLHVGKFYPPYQGGMETHLQDLCRSIAPILNVSVVVSNSAHRSQRDYDGDIPIDRIGTLANIASTPISPAMVKAIRRSPADIIHLHFPNPMAVASYLVSGHSGRVVVTYQSDIVRQQLLRFTYEPLMNHVLSRADAIIAFSPDYIESSPVLSRFRNKCHMIPHGVDPQQFQNADQKPVADIRARFGDRIVLAVGRLVYYKGFEYLIRSIAGTDAQLIIIGKGPLQGLLNDLARECGVVDRVHLLGEVRDVVPYYHAATVFALPSIARSEAFGIVQVEAMACGTPVVNTNLDSGVRFVSLDGVSGLTVPPADASALRQAIRTILDNPGLRERFAAGARERVTQLFTRSQMASKTVDLYRKVLSAGSSQPIGEPAEFAEA